MREIDQSSFSSSAPELDETVVATLHQPEPPEFKELRKQHPKSKFVWHHLSEGERSSDKLTELYKDATILLTGYLLPLPEQAPGLKLVQLYSAGFESFLKDPLFTGSEVAFATASGVHGPQVTEHAFMTLLAINHHFPVLLSQQQSHHWSVRPLLPLVHDLAMQRIGILGYGSIGRQVARVAHSLGMSIHAYTASPRTTPESKRDTGYIVPGTGDPDGTFPEKWFSGLGRNELHEFLKSGLDVLVVAAPLTKDTRHLLSAEEFDILSEPRPKTGKGAFVVNISRGGIIDHGALLIALKKGLGEEGGGLGGASLDVTEPEPLPEDSELWGLKNVVITPHISGVGSAYGERVIGILALNLERSRTGGKLVNIVDRRRGY